MSWLIAIIVVVLSLSLPILSTLRDFVSQCYPPKPKFTEKNLSSLRGKIYLVTGTNSGLGKELAQMLYGKDAKVYMAARSKEKALAAMASIKKSEPNSSGELVYMPLDLADLKTIKNSADNFLSKETKLHVLFNNAGVMYTPPGSTTEQGYELQLGVNNVGTHLFTKLLTPTLVATAKTEPPNTVRVVWVSSSAAEAPFSPTGGVSLDNLDYHKDKSVMHKYAVSKAGNYLQGTEFAKRYKANGVVSIPLNPGNLNTELYRNQSAVIGAFIRAFVLHPQKMGAYTELYAGLSPQVTLEKSG